MEYLARIHWRSFANLPETSRTAPYSESTLHPLPVLPSSIASWQIQTLELVLLYHCLCVGFLRLSTCEATCDVDIRTCCLSAARDFYYLLQSTARCNDITSSVGPDMHSGRRYLFRSHEQFRAADRPNKYMCVVPFIYALHDRTNTDTCSYTMLLNRWT